MIVHVDCNAFYVSCELSTRPGLEGQPVVVASSTVGNSGILLALSGEAKRLGLKRGDPIFKVKDKLEKHKVHVFPADLKKYRQISRRLMQAVLEQDILQDFTQYSVDEFFGQMPVEDTEEARRYIGKVKDRIWESVRIPVSCGGSQTYTLAKTATWYAKHYEGYHGICILQPEHRETALRGLPVDEIWGIGRAYRRKMHYYGIETAWDFVQKKEDFINRQLSAAGMHTWKELQGIPCIVLENLSRQRSIMQTRTFPTMITEEKELQTRISNYVAACAARLREQHAVCKSITCFILTNRHREDLEQYGNKATENLVTATADSGLLVETAFRLLHSIYRPGFQYKRAGVIVSNISSDESVQLDFFEQEDHRKKRRLLQAADALNNRFGSDKIRLAVQGFGNHAQFSEDDDGE